MIVPLRGLAEVLLKTWGVLFLIRAALQLFPVVIQLVQVTSAARPEMRFAVAWNFVHFAVTVAAGVVLLRLGRPIAARLVPDEPSVDVPMTSRFEMVAFGVLGAFLLIQGLRDAGALSYQLATRPKFGEPALDYLWQGAPQNLVGALVQIVAAAFLLFGRAGFARMWRSIRGIEDETNDQRRKTDTE